MKAKINIRVMAYEREEVTLRVMADGRTSGDLTLSTGAYQTMCAALILGGERLYGLLDFRLDDAVFQEGVALQLDARKNRITNIVGAFGNNKP